MRHKSALLRGVTLIGMSASGLIGCGLDTDNDPPDPTQWPAYHYRIASIDLPEQSSEVPAMSIDLDGGGLVDNALGQAYRALRMQFATFDVETPMRARLAADVPWFLTIYDGGSEGAAVRISRGSIVDGAAVPLLEETAPSVGTTFALRTVLRDGGAFIPLGAVSDTEGVAPPGWLSASTTGVIVESWDPTAATAIVGVALAKPDVDAVVFPNLAAYFTRKLAEGTSWFAEQLDRDGSGVITADEVATDPTGLIQAFFAADLGTTEISLGVRITGDRVTF